MATSRRQRLSAEETRERLIDAGLASLAASGLSIGLDAVSLEQAVRDADVSRSSAYAAWSTSDDYSPQEFFQRSVLIKAIDDRSETIQSLQQTSADIVEKYNDTMTPRELLRELIRVAGTENVRSVATSMSWQLVIALRGIIHSSPGGDASDEFAEWMSESEEILRNQMIDEVYKPFCEVVGIEPRPEYGELAFQYGEIAASSLAEGMAMRHSLRAREYLEDIVHPQYPDKERLWSLYSLVFERIVPIFFVPIDGREWDDSSEA